jgi:hypothetical protein
MKFKDHPREIVLSTLGAVAGGVLGFFVFQWLYSYGYYALMLPIAGVGLGGSLFARRASILRAILCTVAGLALGIYTEWHFCNNDSFSYFLTHLNELSPPTCIMLFVGALLCFWLGYGRNAYKIGGDNRAP